MSIMPIEERLQVTTTNSKSNDHLSNGPHLHIDPSTPIAFDYDVETLRSKIVKGVCKVSIVSRVSSGSNELKRFERRKLFRPPLWLIGVISNARLDLFDQS